LSHFAFVFPGQGSQSVGMLNAWQEHHAVVRETLQEANDALGFDLAAMISEGPADRLNLTVNTQPAVLAADVAIWRAWQNAGGPRPRVVAGHSLGEYAALVAADAIDFADAVRLVHDRGRWMQEAVPAGQGGMAAIVGLDDEAVRRLCSDNAAGEVLEAVNYNAPGQVVIAGHNAAIQRALSVAKDAGARLAIALPVSVPAHSSLMTPAADQLAEALKPMQFRSVLIPVVHNLSGRRAAQDQSVPDLLSGQLKAPVQWVQSLLTMRDEFQISAGLECGPGQVLCGLAKRSIKSIPFYSLAQPDQLELVMTKLDHKHV
jgi:[acyl-carrier-protein] S-malonyltransferase